MVTLSILLQCRDDKKSLYIPALYQLLLSYHVQLISAALEHFVLRALEIYALENAMFYIAVYLPYKP